MGTIEYSFFVTLKSANIFKEFIQKQNYEAFLLEVIKKSGLLQSDLELVLKQDEGEADYFSPSTGEYYEATLIIDNYIVPKIIKDVNYVKTKDFEKWISDEIYKNVVDALERKKNRNNIILFNIFPMRYSGRYDGIFSQFCNDEWDSLISKIAQTTLDKKNKKIFLVSFNFDNHFLVKQLIENKYFRKYIEIDFQQINFPFEVFDLTDKRIN